MFGGEGDGEGGGEGDGKREARMTQTTLERSGSGVELRTLDYENPGSNPVLRC